MTRDEAEMVMEYYADIRRKLGLIRRQREALNDEVASLRGMNLDGMPRSSMPGDSTAALAVKMDELGISDQLGELAREEAALKADAALIREKLAQLWSVHSEILVKRYVFGCTWERVRAKVDAREGGQRYSIPHLKRLRNVALVRLAEKLEHLPGKAALLERAYNARMECRDALREAERAEGEEGTPV